MDIRNANDAREWLRAWCGSPRRGVLSAAIDGCRMAASIMDARPDLYSQDSRDDASAAVSALERAGGAT